MATSSRRRAFRPTGKFYIFIGIVAVAAVVVLLMLLGGDTSQVREGSIEYSTTRDVVIVRDEQVIAAEHYERADYLVPDQQRVEAGTAVADVYRWGYNEKVMNDLMDVQTRILQYDENNLGATSAELADLDEQITAQAAVIRRIANGAEGDAISAERELQGLMDERAAYLRERAPQDDQALADYYRQEQQLEERVASWVDTWTAPSAGVVSYYYDGYEPVVNAENIRSIGYQTVKGILDGDAAMAQPAEGARPLYRLVNNFQWYAVIPTDEPVQELANETMLTVVFDDCPDRQFQGQVIGNIAEGDARLYVVQFSEDIGSLVNTRRARARLSTTITGLEVPEGAVQTVDGQTGVRVRNGRQAIFVPVQVRIVKDGRAIVEPLDGSAGLSAGSSVEV